MTVATEMPVTKISDPRSARTCVCCERSLAAVIQSWPDGAMFLLCVGCLVDIPSTTLVPIIPIQR